MQQQKKEEIDREKTCPFLIKVFWKLNGTHELDEFANQMSSLQKDELQIYAWKDTSLRDIVDNVKTMIPEVLKRDQVYKIFVIYQDSRGNLKKKELGVVTSYKQRIDYTTLTEHKFQIGDYLDISIIQAQKQQNKLLLQQQQSKDNQLSQQISNNEEK